MQHFAPATSTPPTPHYVVAVAAAPTRIAAASSSGAVAVYDAERLQQTGGGVHGAGGATGVALLGDAAVAAASGADGGVSVWDARTGGAPCLRLTTGAPAKPLHCVGGCASLVAAGGDGAVWLWDGRAATSAPLACFGDGTHDGDVTVLAFRGGGDDATFCSGGVDGLIAQWAPTGGRVDEDSAFVGALNVGTSVAAAGWYARGARLWVTTGVEGVATWHAAAAADADAPGGEGAEGAVADARPLASAVGAPADYVVGCVADESSASLCLVTVDHAGAAALVTPDAATLVATLGGGHSATVRSAAAAGGGRLVTGAEDGRVVVWAPGAAVAGGTQRAAPPAAVGGKARKFGGAARRPSPY